MKTIKTKAKQTKTPYYKNGKPTAIHPWKSSFKDKERKNGSQ